MTPEIHDWVQIIGSIFAMAMSLFALYKSSNQKKSDEIHQLIKNQAEIIEKNETKIDKVLKNQAENMEKNNNEIYKLLEKNDDNIRKTLEKNDDKIHKTLKEQTDKITDSMEKMDRVLQAHIISDASDISALKTGLMNFQVLLTNYLNNK